MNFRVSFLALTIVFVSFQNCGNVKFEETNKTVHKISEEGTELNSGSNGNGGSGNGNIETGSPEDNNEIPEYTEGELTAAACSNGTEQGYLICHFPPGNWQALQTLCVGRNALNAHLRHGHSGVPGHPRDLLGSCEDNF